MSDQAIPETVEEVVAGWHYSVDEQGHVRSWTFDLAKPCTPVCNHCEHYAFNGDESGAYVNAGRCEHPDHLHASEPDQFCEDFNCEVCHD